MLFKCYSFYRNTKLKFLYWNSELNCQLFIPTTHSNEFLGNVECRMGSRWFSRYWWRYSKPCHENKLTLNLVLGRPSCSWSGDQHIIPHAGGQHHNLRYLPYQTTGTANSYQPPSCSFPEGDFRSPATSNIIPRSAGQQHNLRYLPNQTTGPTNSYQPQSGSYPEGSYPLHTAAPRYWLSSTCKQNWIYGYYRTSERLTQYVGQM